MSIQSASRKKAVEPVRRPFANIMEVLKADGRYKILTAALEDTSLDERLRSTGPYTIFAPTDEAFQKVPKLAELLHDTERLRAVLSRHIVWGYLDAQALWGISLLAPINGQALRIAGKNFLIEDAGVVQPNLQAPNGIIHGLSRVIMDDSVSVLREAGAKIEETVKAGAAIVLEAVQAGTAKLDATFQSQKEAYTGFSF